MIIFFPRLERRLGVAECHLPTRKVFGGGHSGFKSPRISKISIPFDANSKKGDGQKSLSLRDGFWIVAH
ncbi:hypothetical protein SDJN03_03888, partial [Cucurbita argyrosperma subsp. sororia]